MKSTASLVVCSIIVGGIIYAIAIRPSGMASLPAKLPQRTAVLLPVKKSVEQLAPVDNSNDPLGYDPVERDQAKWFSDWVLKSPGLVVGSAITQEQRQQYAETQNNASDALLAYEKSNDYYTGVLAIAINAEHCHLRQDIWVWNIKERLRITAQEDVVLQTIRNALTDVEKETADMFATYSVHFHQQFQMGDDPKTGCSSLASMPFLATLDDYEAGTIKVLPKPGG